jgi:two-component system, OmpR family, sensor kinase
VTRLDQAMPPPPSRWTLRAKLLASVLALFTVVMLATSALTVVETRRYLEKQLVEGLQNARGRVVDGARPGDGDGDGDGGPGRTPGGPLGGDPALVLRLTASGEVAFDRRLGPVNSVVNEDNKYDALDASQIATILRAPLDANPTRVELGGDVGSYLVTSRPSGGGGRLIVGVPTEQVDELLAKVVATVAGGTLVGLVLVALGGTIVIRRSLAPLDRVAATARRVSALQLGSGQVALAERVPAADADERTEVGQVGLALNTMLDNVESALLSRQESEMQVRQFVADASHELRTPLASIRG